MLTHGDNDDIFYAKGKVNIFNNFPIIYGEKEWCRIVTMEWNTEDKQTCVFLKGSICENDSIEIEDSLTMLITNGQKTLLIDFSQVDYVDDSLIATLLATYIKASKSDCKISLLGLAGYVKEWFELTRLNKVFDIH